MRVWLPVVGYEGTYEVSADGLVRRVGGPLMSQWPRKEGYLLVKLSLARTGKREGVGVHRLVAAAFIPNPNGFNTVNHLDCDTDHNHYTNLEWCNQTHNIKYAWSLGRMCTDYWKGKRSPNARITDEQVAEIRRDYRPRVVSMQLLASRYGVSKKAVSNVLGGHTFSRIPLPPQEGK